MKKLLLEWKSVRNATGYIIKVYDETGKEYFAKKVPSTVTTYEIEVQEGVDYKWSVIPFNMSGPATSIKEWSFTTVKPDYPEPTVPIYPLDGAIIDLTPTPPTTGPWLTTLKQPEEQSDGSYNLEVVVHEFFNVGAISLSLKYDNTSVKINSITPHVTGMAVNDIEAQSKLRAGWFASSESGVLNYPPVPMTILTINFSKLEEAQDIIDFVWEHENSACEYAGYGGTPIYFEAQFIDLSWIS